MQVRPHQSSPAFEPLESRQLMSVQVFASSAPINNGDTTSGSGAAFFQYGFFRQGDTGSPRSVTYDISNPNQSAITITQLTVPTGFKILSGSAAGTLLAVNATPKELTIQLDKTIPGKHTGNVIIKSSDGDTFTFEITGTVGTYAVGAGYDLGTIGSAHKTGDLTYSRVTDGSGSAVTNPGVSVYHFDLTAPHNNVALALNKPNSDGYGVNMKIYRDANDDGILQVSEQQEIFPKVEVDPGAESPTTHDSKFGTLAAGSYLMLCTTTTNIPYGTTTDAYDFTVTAAAQPDPKIAVQASKKTAVANNDLTPSAADGTDFSTVPVGSLARRDFIITNSGSAPLVLNPAAFLSSNTNFAIDAGLPASIPAGGTARLGILLLTTTAGDASAQVVIPTNDPAAPQFKFAVKGHVNSITHVAGIPPVATLLTGLRVRTIGGTFYKFTIRYTDDTGVDLASINSSDITVTGPGNFNSEVRLLTKTASNNGTQVDAFYRLAARDGTWDRGDNGLYTFNLNGNEVSDMTANFTVPEAIGQFTVRIPKTSAPAAIVAPNIFSDTAIKNDKNENALFAA